MTLNEQDNDVGRMRANGRAVALFYGVALVLCGPWLYNSAMLLPHGDAQAFFVRLSRPLKVVSETVHADVVRRTVETTIGAWLNNPDDDQRK